MILKRLYEVFVLFLVFVDLETQWKLCCANIDIDNWIVFAMGIQRKNWIWRISYITTGVHSQNLQLTHKRLKKAGDTEKTCNVLLLAIAYLGFKQRVGQMGCALSVSLLLNFSVSRDQVHLE